MHLLGTVCLICMCIVREICTSIRTIPVEDVGICLGQAGFINGLPETDTHIFYGMVRIDVQISRTMHVQIKQTVPSKCIEHVIEKTDTRLYVTGSLTIETQL